MGKDVATIGGKNSERSMKKIFLIFLCFMTSSFAAEDYYSFSSEDQQKNFSALTSELRCLVCQNQNIAESNAPLAADLRGQIYQQIRNGKSKQEIIDYLIARYGHFILYRPPVNAGTLLLWIGPFFLLLISMIYLIYYLRKNKNDFVK